ncbi:MAG: hypothetical protein U5J98_10240 [Halobacteriales archaeon]|nr:hypothetical protein [Halobacteriales archaeon]
MVPRAAVGWALLFAIPPGVGVTGYASMLMGGRLIEPGAIAVGAVVGGSIFALVLGAQLGGSAEPEAVRERVD